eukprot:scaffold596257_cov47-Prasinocladus_malaysianus.AAC.1
MPQQERRPSGRPNVLVFLDVIQSELVVQEKKEGLINADPTKTAFAALDKWQRAQDSNSSDSEGSVEDSRQSAGGIFSALEEENLRVDRHGKPSKPAPKAAKKPKQCPHRLFLGAVSGKEAKGASKGRSGGPQGQRYICRTPASR